MTTPRDLQLDWLRCFVAVVDAGSLSAAAHDVHRSQSAVSMQLKKLETALGQRLLDRGPRHLQLTAHGQRLMGYARRMLALHSEALLAFQETPVTGLVRLGVAEDFAAHYLTPVLKRFTPMHAGIDIELYCEQSNALIPRVDSGELDLALISRHQDKQGVLVFREPMVWVGAPQFALWQRDVLPVAVYDASSVARRGALQSLVARGRPYKIVYQSSSLAGQLAAVESGLAIAALTRCCTPDGLQILGEEQGLGPLDAVDVTLYRHKRTAVAVDTLERFLREAFSAMRLQ